MNLERRLVTREQISRIEQGEEYSHPVIAVLDRYTPQIVGLNARFSALTDPDERKRFYSQHFGFLGEAIESSGPFYKTRAPENY